MSTIRRSAIAEQAHKHLGDQSPVNTCLALGMNKWPQELDLPGIGTNSVSEAERRARAGHNGWTYHQGMDGVQVGDFLDWKPSALGDRDSRHVSVVTDIDDDGNLQSIGAGGPTGKVYWQPQGGGHNPRSYFDGYFRAPTTRTDTGPTKTTGSTPASTYTVKRGDYLLRIASKHHTTVGRIVELNRLRNPDHIEVGQVLKLR